MSFTAVCSPRPRTQLHSGRKGGNQWWARDPYHIRRKSDPKRTRCGVDCSEWLNMGVYTEATDDCCARCLSITDPAKQ